MILLGGVYFFLLIALFVYLPGKFALRVSKFPVIDPVIRFPLAIGIGSTFFIASIYLLSWIHADILYFFALLPIIFIEVKNSSKNYKTLSFPFPLYEIVTIVVGSLLALYITGRSGYETNGNLLFYGVNATDAIFHISLIGNLIHHFPPTHAGLAEIPLHGYNFLYDLFVATFAKFFSLDTLDLFFRYFSLFVALFYGFSSLALARFLKMDSVTSRFFLFLAYFTQGAIFIFTFFHIMYDPGIVQPLANIVDPSVLFSISLFYLAIILIFSMNNRYHVLLAAVIVAVLPMIKIYTAFLLFAAIFITTFVAFSLKKKEKWYLVSTFLIAGILGGAIYAPINLGIGKLIFAPFLFYSHFLESYAPMNHSDWWMRLLVYFEHHNYLRIIQNYILLLALFFIPSLSLRLFAFGSIRSLFTKRFYTLQNIFIMSAIFIGILIPSFFIQNIAVFVIVQFLWITYFLLLIPTAFGLSRAYSFVPYVGKIVLVIAILLFSLPDLLTILSLYNHNPLVVLASRVAIAKEMRKSIPQSEHVVVLNAKLSGQRVEVLYSIPLISALSEHDVYYEPEVLEFTGLDNEIAKRKKNISIMNQTLSQCASTSNNTMVSLLKNIQSNYVVTIEDNSCMSTLSSFTLLSRKGEAALYKLR